LNCKVLTYFKYLKLLKKLKKLRKNEKKVFLSFFKILGFKVFIGSLKIDFLLYMGVERDF